MTVRDEGIVEWQRSFSLLRRGLPCPADRDERPHLESYAERLIGSIRREYIDHVIVFGERHLRHLLRSYLHYYNGTRTHLSLDKDTPISRAVEAVGRVISRPVLGGLYHRYERI